MAQLFTALLKTQSPHYSDWLSILGSERVPIKSPHASRACLGEEHDVEVYQLDLDMFSAAQRDRLVQWTALKFGVAPALIEEQLAGVGFSIRAEDVVVSYSWRAFL